MVVPFPQAKVRITTFDDLKVAAEKKMRLAPATPIVPLKANDKDWRLMAKELSIMEFMVGL